ncbi:hypothetical protein ILUMI_17206 [Ignelater luminosus]|uniref:PiggyBac transposable element-derived protein domain-containing protein n=1 Tax=Ignelater luminosus TaxID=2038154 RepID=A0A8K0CRF7_IGNLU|nr:hypothetical protein ILUMI_17206 [Ignelater luminosus]
MRNIIRNIPSENEDFELSDDDILEPLQPSVQQTSNHVYPNDDIGEDLSSDDSESNIPLIQLAKNVSKKLVDLKNITVDINQIADVMPVNRFEEIKRFIHFIDKILPLLNQIHQACLSVPSKERLPCDDEVISFRGRSSLKICNHKRLHKWGYKIWVLSGTTGFSYDFELYSGKQKIAQLEEEQDLGAASNVELG